jgi:alkylation response protein AidB-like acyl-CoA dehydrogenase
MSIAITADHRALEETVAEVLQKRESKAAARALLEGAEEGLPPFWDEVKGLGWLGLHVPEDQGGSGYGLEELVIVVEQLGRAIAPGPFVPTVAASAVLVQSPGEVADRWLPGLASGDVAGAFALGGEVTVDGGTASGSAGVVLGGALAQVLLVRVGDDVAVVDVSGDGVSVEVPQNLDPTRTAARVTLDGAPAEVLPGAGQVLVDLARLVLAAEATGIARECTEQAAEYAKERQQFGRPIAMFQAVKHHCANMAVATELATCAVWDASRAVDAEVDGAERSLACALAATQALPAADLCANLNIQVHGGIGFTWEHDAHLYLRRATALAAIVDSADAAGDATDLVRAGATLERGVELPPEAEAFRDEVRTFAEGIKDKSDEEQRDALIETGYVQPHWPKPYGREAGPVEQLVIAEELKAAGITRPAYGITGWVILTLIQHATEDQVVRWVPQTLRQEVIWCQLFSEPDAGSDAAGVKTKATRVDGGWLVNGQKVWTSGAHYSSFGLITVRTNPDVPKHQGITTMVVDMHAEGVEVRPLKMTNGGKEFNEVFFNDVLVPDDDVVGPVDGGWTVARATLGNESVSIGGGDGGMAFPGSALIPPFDAHPERLAGGAARVGRYIANAEGLGALNIRSVHRAVGGDGPGPEGAITKLVLSEQGHEAAAALAELAGPESAFLDGEGAMGGMLVLMHRAMSIAGGTSEIKRNQIGERILGLPRDPLIK